MSQTMFSIACQVYKNICWKVFRNSLWKAVLQSVDMSWRPLYRGKEMKGEGWFVLFVEHHAEP